MLEASTSLSYLLLSTRLKKHKNRHKKFNTFLSNGDKISHKKICVSHVVEVNALRGVIPTRFPAMYIRLTTQMPSVRAHGLDFSRACARLREVETKGSGVTQPIRFSAGKLELNIELSRRSQQRHRLQTDVRPRGCRLRAPVAIVRTVCNFLSTCSADF